MDKNRKLTPTAVAVMLLLAVGVVMLIIVLQSQPPTTSSAGGQVVIEPAATTLPFDAKHYAELGQQLARERKITEAIEQYRLAIKADPQNHWYWYLTACLLAYNSDAGGQQAHCREMLALFADARESHVVERLVRASLLMPRPEADVAEAQQMLDRVMRLNIAPAQLPWVHLAKGMADYRAGRFQESIDWLTQARDSAGMNFPSGKVTADFFIAMAQARLGDMQSAGSSLQSAENRIASQMSGLNRGEFGAAIDNWLMCLVVRRETNQTLSGKPPAPR